MPSDADDLQYRPCSVVPPRRRAAVQAEDGGVAASTTLDTPPAEPLIAADASLLEAQAQLKRADLDSNPEHPARERVRADADELAAQAARLRDPARFGLPELLHGRGGEVSPLPEPSMPHGLREVARAVHATPTVQQAEASVDRLTLAREAGALSLAVDAAESVEAEGAIQQMLAHQVAAGHATAMRLLAAVQLELKSHGRDRLSGGGERAFTAAARTAMAAARLMDSVTHAAHGLDRLQNGGRQHVTVQHVVVADGGQAVVAGSVGGDRPARRLPKRR